MFTLESFSFYIMLSVLAPIIGAFSLLFLFIFEKRLDQLQKEKKELLLKQELQLAKYNQLNQQIQPHFFFNTLNVILSLARLNKKEELITSIEILSKYFKLKYTTVDPLISLEQEITYTQYYLSIQHLRFRNRVEYVWNIEENCLPFQIPPFLLQTLVENAFKHGIEKNPGPGKLIITLKEERDQVFLKVWNSVATSSKNSESKEGLGLENIEKRLQMLFPLDTVFIHLYAENQGVSVQVLWPKVKDRHHFTL